MEKYGLYDFSLEYTKLHDKIKKYWLSNKVEDKLLSYAKLKYTINVFNNKRKISIVDVSDANTTIYGNQSIQLVQQYMHSIKLLKEFIKMNSEEIINDLLTYTTWDKINDIYEVYVKDINEN